MVLNGLCSIKNPERDHHQFGTIALQVD